MARSSGLAIYISQQARWCLAKEPESRFLPNAPEHGIIYESEYSHPQPEGVSVHHSLAHHMPRPDSPRPNIPTWVSELAMGVWRLCQLFIGERVMCRRTLHFCGCKYPIPLTSYGFSRLSQYGQSQSAPQPRPPSALEVKMFVFVELWWRRIPRLRDQSRKWLWRPLGRKTSKCFEHD